MCTSTFVLVSSFLELIFKLVTRCCRFDLLSLSPLTLECEPGGSVRGEQANFTGLVLGCIEAKFCK